MKVLLISPPNIQMLQTNVPRVVDHETGIYPTLGLLYIASAVLKFTHHKIEIIDAKLANLDNAKIELEIKKRMPDLVGIPATTFTIIDALTIAKSAKDVSANIIVCLGGPHPTMYPEETLDADYIDYLVLREGEYTFCNLLNALESKTDLSHVRGIAYKSNHKIITTAFNDFIENLDDLPHPARHLTPYRRYYSLLARYLPITTMITSRGCPYQCSFCHRPHLGRKFRCRSAKNVVDEMEECAAMGIKEFFIYDDTFTIDKNRTINICNEIIQRRLHIHWDIRTRVDTINENMLLNLKKAGCERIHYGVEAGTNEILKEYRKDISLKLVKKTFALTKKHKLTTLAYFMLGAPNETSTQIKKTIAFAKKLNPDYCHFSLTTPFPKTPLYAYCLKSGIFEQDFWQQFALSPTPVFKPRLCCHNIPAAELKKFLNLAYKTFYLRPGYIIKKIFHIRTFSELFRKIKAGINLFWLK
ncbi:MAG: radical SAM protein [Candidatus Omnitrophota bacterium]